MTNTTGYLVISEQVGLRLMHYPCGTVLHTTELATLQALTNLAHDHSLTCKKHSKVKEH